jgi:hypothetical protein
VPLGVVTMYQSFGTVDLPVRKALDRQWHRFPRAGLGGGSASNGRLKYSNTARVVITVSGSALAEPGPWPFGPLALGGPALRRGALWGEPPRAPGSAIS